MARPEDVDNRGVGNKDEYGAGDGADKEKLEADYLVIGAGAVCLAFVDELLTQSESATFIIVDKQPAPGGHWNAAYPFVTLHQVCSCCTHCVTHHSFAH